MAATYAHATAPLRRLADRYVIETAVLIAAGQPVSAELQAAFQTLPAVMAKAEARASQVERAVSDLAEAIVLDGREGSRFDAVVTDVDERGADPAVRPGGNCPCRRQGSSRRRQGQGGVDERRRCPAAEGSVASALNKRQKANPSN